MVINSTNINITMTFKFGLVNIWPYRPGGLVRSKVKRADCDHYCLNFPFCGQWVKIRGHCYVDIGGINDNYCLNFLFCGQWVKMRGDCYVDTHWTQKRKFKQ
jgi:hypothetical protein